MLYRLFYRTSLKVETTIVVLYLVLIEMPVVIAFLYIAFSY